MYFYRIYTEITTGGTIREVYGIVGGGTGDTYCIEYNQPQFTMTYGILVYGIPINPITNYK